MKKLILTAILLFSSTTLAGNFSGSGNSKSILILPEMMYLQSMSEFTGTAQFIQASQSVSQDKPYIEQTQWGDILRYPQNGESIEAWEVIENFIDPDLHGSVFLNYSRFPYGELQYNGKPTYVCYALVGDAIYFGSSENPLRMTNAILHLAMERGLMADRQSAQCQKTDVFLARYSSAKSVSDLILELKSALMTDI